jgi:hypothetical protein
MTSTAAAESIITPAQVATLRAFAEKREHALQHGHEKRFRFMRSFNDCFFAIGVLSPSSAWANASRPFVFFATILILGVFVIALGAGWLPLHRVLLRLLPSSLANRLPPALAAA